jgi:hypothetical protein
MSKNSEARSRPGAQTGSIEFSLTTPAVALEELAVSGERILGSRLAHIAENVRQVIWGEFKGYEDILSNTPTAVVIAFDSSWWEIQSADVTLLDRVAEAFKGIKRVQLQFL